ncbi:hypothetical protein TWF718_010782 [Orbilia javanica]|uniref:Uncharacterized protein n=1 Tax=Orbilia javanica TaxID=47235 RepID=A0AAN8R942_9PEZI
MAEELSIREWLLSMAFMALPYLPMIIYGAFILYSFKGTRDLVTLEPDVLSESGSNEFMDCDGQWFEDDGSFEFVMDRDVRQETVAKRAEMKRVSDLYDKFDEKRTAEHEEELRRLGTEEPEDTGAGYEGLRERNSGAKSRENVSIGEGSSEAKRRGMGSRV